MALLRYLAKRVPSAVLVLFLASAAIFLIIRLIPGDPAAALAGQDATPAEVAAVRQSLGLDQPIPVQYVHWLGNFLTGNLGRSYVLGGSISTLVSTGFVNTLVLAMSALVISVIITLIVGPVWAVTRHRWVDYLFTGVNTVAVAVPTFVSGVLLVLIFAVALPILPSGGFPPGGLAANIGITWQYLLLPALCLALPVAAALSRYLTELLRTELRQPYIVTATALGVSSGRRVLRHAMRNALPSTLTVLGIQVGSLLGGAVLVEGIFSWPGVGQLIQQAILSRDYPVVQALLLLAVAIFVVVQLITDILHAFLDPRVRIIGGAE